MSAFPVRTYVVRQTPMFVVPTLARLGEEESEMTRTMNQETSKLTKALIEAVIRQVALSMSIQIALYFAFPPVSIAIGAAITVIQTLTGQIYGDMTSRMIKNTISEIEDRSKKVENIVKEAAKQVFQEEFAAGNAMAWSGQNIDGLGQLGGFSSVCKSVSNGSKAFNGVANVKKFVDSAGHVISKTTHKTLEAAKSSYKAATTDFLSQARTLALSKEAQLKLFSTISPVNIARLGVKYSFDVAQEAAEIVEATGVVKKGTLTQPLEKISSEVDDTGKIAAVASVSPGEAARLVLKINARVVAEGLKAAGQKDAAEDVLAVYKVAEDFCAAMKYLCTPAGFRDLLTGRESYLAVKKACEEMKARVFALLAKMQAEYIAKLRSPKGRAAMRKSIAHAVRNDKKYQDYLTELALIEAAEQMQASGIQVAKLEAFKKLESGVTPSRTIEEQGGSSSGGVLMGTAAAALAALAFTR